MSWAALWTETEQHEALAQGWHLATRDDGVRCIEKSDEADIFETDEKAAAYVFGACIEIRYPACSAVLSILLHPIELRSKL